MNAVLPSAAGTSMPKSFFCVRGASSISAGRAWYFSAFV